MALSLKEAMVLPAKQEKVLDKLWIRQILIQTPSPLTEGSVKIEYGPWSGDLTEDAVWRDSNGNDIAQFINVNELYSTMAKCPELKAAFAAILAAIEPIQNLKQEQEQEQEQEQPVVES